MRSPSAPLLPIRLPNRLSVRHQQQMGICTGIDYRPRQTEDFKIGVCSFPACHSVQGLRRVAVYSNPRCKSGSIGLDEWHMHRSGVHDQRTSRKHHKTKTAPLNFSFITNIRNHRLERRQELVLAHRFVIWFDTATFIYSFFMFIPVKIVCSTAVWSMPLSQFAMGPIPYSGMLCCTVCVR